MTPLISALLPDHGDIGSSVTIVGQNFGAAQGSSTITFNGIAASPTGWSDTAIVTQVPTGATTGNVVVMTSDGSSNGFLFTIFLSASTLPVGVDQFLEDLPAFDTGQVTDPNLVQIDKSSIAFWLNIASKMLNQNRWPDPDIYNLGIEMFAAHHVALETLAARDMQVAGVPGVAAGIVAGKSAGDVSITYDTGSVVEFDAGHWNYTVYGKRFIRLARLAGAGPIQVNIGCGPGSTGMATGAWPGPYPVPTPETPQ